MPRPIENPVVPRMAWVAKHYNDYVTFATFGAWAEAAGQHNLREHFARIGRDRGYDAKEALRSLPRLIQTWRAPTTTRFDRYLPWFAREVNRIYKPYKKLRKKYAPDLPAFPPWYDPASRRLTGDSSRIVPEVWLTAEHLATYTRDFQNVFRVIVDWAEAENIDLNRWQWPDVERVASDWGHEQQRASVTPGTVVYAWPDGWTVQILTTERQLRDEGEAMQHCVGEYFADVQNGTVQIFSLRDPAGHPHATMEWLPRAGNVGQLKGKQNALPIREYALRMIPFRREVLDPQAKVRPVPGIDEHRGILGWFLEDYLGAWAFNPRGTLRNLIGSYGGMEQAMTKDEVYVVFQRPGRDFKELAAAYPLHDLDESIEEARERLQPFAPPTDDPDAQAAWEDEELRQWAQISWVGGNGNRPLAPEDAAPGLAWAVWQKTGFYFRDADDEMLEAMEAGEIEPDDAEIPTGGAMTPAVRQQLAPLLR